MFSVKRGKSGLSGEQPGKFPLSIVGFTGSETQWGNECHAFCRHQIMFYCTSPRNVSSDSGGLWRMSADKNLGEIKILGQRLRAWRKTNSLKAKEFSSLIGVSQGALSEIENSKSLPSAGTLAKLCLNTDIDIVWLLTNKGPMTQKDFQFPANLFQNNGFSPACFDQKFWQLLDKFIRVYYLCDPVKKSHLQGFLAGADPEKNWI